MDNAKIGITDIDKIMIGNVVYWQRVELSPYLLFADFNLPDSTTSPGSATTGQTPSNSINTQATWGIQNNELYCVSNSGSSMPFIYWNDGKVSKRISIDVLFTASNPRIVFRVKDGSNFLAVAISTGSVLFQKVVGGSWTTIMTYSTSLTYGTWYNFKIEDRETSINVYLDDVLVATSNDTTHNTYTSAGIRFGNASNLTARFDNYKVEELS